MPFDIGTRVKLTRTLLDETTDIHPVHLYARDTGMVIKTNRDIDATFDRYNGDIVTVHQLVNGEMVHILDLITVAEQG